MQDVTTPVKVGKDGVVPNLDGKTYFMVDSDTQDYISFAYSDAAFHLFWFLT